MKSEQMRCIAIGAEAKVYGNDTHIIKERVPKGYRHKRLDDSLRKFRTRREAKVLTRLEEKGFPAPRLIRTDEREMVLEMTKLTGTHVKALSDDRLTDDVFYRIGQLIGKLHAYDIIHGDLTTSNIFFDSEAQDNTNVSFIDFGLSFFSQRLEDKAVELHLCFEAIDSAHYAIADRAEEAIRNGYAQSYPAFDDVFERLCIVEKRGRYKQKKKENKRDH
jgi:Kae1-associated kinase Bud32